MLVCLIYHITNNMPLQYQQQKTWFNGITDDKFLWNWYVTDAEWVNIRSSRGVTLSNSKYSTVVSDVSWSLSSNSIYRVHTILNATKTTWPIQKEIYGIYGTWVINTSDSSIFNPVGLSAAVNATLIKSWWVNYWVVARSGNTWAIWRRDDDTQSITNMASYMNLSYTSEYRPLLYNGWFLYVWGNWAVEAIDVSTTTWVVAYTVTIPWDCRGLTMIWDQIFIYSNDGKNWYKMSWDWVSAFPLYIQQWADNPVINVANIWNYDYVVCGVGIPPVAKYRRLRKTAWFEKWLLFWSDYLERDNDLFNFSPIHTNAIETAKNTLFVPWRWSIYLYWTERASLPDALAKEIVIWDCTQVTALYFDWANDMYIAYYNTSWISKILKQELRAWRAYWDTWTVSTITWDWWDIETEKTNNRIVVWYKLAHKWSYNTSIDLYARINQNEYWVFICSNPTSPIVPWDKYTRNGLEFTVEEYTSSWEIICIKWENWPYNNSITNVSGTLTRSYWAWPSTVLFTDVTNYIYIWSITDIAKRKVKIPFQRKWYSMDIKAKLNTEHSEITPELYSIKTLFDYCDLDNG